MTKPFRYVTVGLISDDSAADPRALERSFLGRGALRCVLNSYIAELAPDAIRDESLGSLWSEIKPKDGRFRFEVATALPFFLPTVDGRSEYVVKTVDAEYFVCLRIARVFFGPGIPTDHGASYFLAHLGAVGSLAHAAHGSAGLHVVPLKTYISRTFEVEAATASEAVEQNFRAWREQLITGIASLVDAIRTVDPKGARHLLPQLAAASFPTFWVFAEGEDPTRIGCQQFAGDLGSAAFRPLTTFTQAQFQEVQAALAGEAPHSAADVALGLARTFCHYGYLTLAVVQLCVACESALWQAFRTFILSKGGSKSRLDESEGDISFSQLLNVHIFAMRDVTRMVDASRTIGQVNWARKRRNEAVHEGAFAERVTKEQLEGAIEAGEHLIAFLRAPENLPATGVPAGSLPPH